MTDLRQAATFALTTLHGWSNHDSWAWPSTALAQAKQNTAEAIPLLEAALAEPEPELEPTLREEFTMILNEARCNSTGRVIGNIELGRRLVKAVEQFMCAQPESEGLPLWTEGICGDGAALLKDGVMVPIEEVVRELNRGAQARAALAEPEPKGPTDEEIEEWADACPEAPLEELDPEVYGWRRCFTAHEFSETIRAAIARWGNHPGSPDRSGNLKAGLTRSPAAGEVAELVAWLRRSTGCADESPMDLRAADLLERLSSPQPVPVSEHLPGPGDCTTNPRTGEGQWCWGWVQHDPIPYSGRWRMIRREWLVDEAKAWLPAHALPLPGEAEHG